MANDNTPELSVRIGQRIAELRYNENISGDVVTAEAQAVGLRWTRSTLAFIETARRGISAEELLVLPLVMTRALGRNVTLRDLMPKQAKMSRVLTLTTSMFDLILDGSPVRWEAPRNPQHLREVLVG